MPDPLRCAACQAHAARRSQRRARHARRSSQLARQSLPAQAAGERGARRTAHVLAGQVRGPAARAAPQRVRLVQHVQHAMAERALCARARAGRSAPLQRMLPGAHTVACNPEPARSGHAGRARGSRLPGAPHGPAPHRPAACARTCRRCVWHAERPPRCRSCSGLGPLLELPRTAVLLRDSRRPVRHCAGAPRASGQSGPAGRGRAPR